MNPTMIARVAAACAAAACIAVPSAASASVGVVNASAFSSNGSVKDGWSWVHQDTETASWTFNITSLASAKPGSVYLNVEALVTNQPNGGSGFSATGVKFTATCGAASQTLVVKLVNHFRPVNPGDSLGLGYAASGHSSAALKLKRFDGCSQITVTTKGDYPQQRSIGFKQASAYLGYS